MADVTIGDLELGDNPGDGDLFEVEQGGHSKRLTFAQIKAAATGETTLPVGAHPHWRIFIEEAGPPESSWFARINELRFRKDEADLPLDGTASASAEGHVNNPASTAFDGDGSTVWASTATGPAWLAYSFSEAVEVDEISLKAGDTQARADDMPAVFLVEFSDDGENWTSVQSYTTSPWAVDETRLFDVPFSYPVSYVPEAPEEGIGFVRKDKGWVPEKTVAGLPPSAGLSETDELPLSQEGFSEATHWRILAYTTAAGSVGNDLRLYEVQFREQKGVPQPRTDEALLSVNIVTGDPVSRSFDNDLSSYARKSSSGPGSFCAVGLSREEHWFVREVAIYYTTTSIYRDRGPGTFDIQMSSDGENWATVASIEGFVPPASGWHTFSTATPATERKATLSQLKDFMAGGIPEAPADGRLYGRKDEGWEVVTGGGGAELAPWGGARIVPTATQNYPSGSGKLRFTSADYDTDGFWSPEYPNRLTVPAGVTRVRLYGCVKVDSSDTIPRNNTFSFAMNDTANFQGNGGVVLETDGYNNPHNNLVSDAIEVTEGDYFEMRYSVSQSFSLAADRGRTWFAIEILERTYSNTTLGNLLDVEAPAPTVGQSLVFDPVSGKWKPGVPVVNVNQATGLNKPFRGALVKLSDDAVISSTPNFVGWHDVEYDTDGFWSAGEPSKITIPAGIKKVRLSASVQVQGTISANENFSVAIAKAGSNSYVGNGWGANRSGYRDSAFTAHTAVIEVSQGDFFEVRFNKSTSDNVTLLSRSCSFSIEVVETEDPLP